MSKPDLVSVIEAAYDVELGVEPWLNGVIGSLTSLDQGMGVFGFLYHVGSDGRVSIDHGARARADNEAFLHYQGGVGAMPPEYVRRTFCSLLAATMSELGGPEYAFFTKAMSRFGALDSMGLNGFNPGGPGVWVGALLPSPRVLSPAQVLLQSRVARHLAAAARLRAALAATPQRGGPEAVLDPDGRVKHAEGDAKAPRSLEALRSAVAAISRARGPLRQRSIGQAMAYWRVLVRSRWTLVDHFERGGRRYVVAEVNPLVTTNPMGLTPRERQVVAYLGLGYSTKVIAYELGISDVTVRVLLSRAASRLGLRSRKELESWAAQHPAG